MEIIFVMAAIVTVVTGVMYIYDYYQNANKK